MRVNIAAKVHSETVGNFLNSFDPEEAEETGQFRIMMNKFFDCLNVRNTKENIVKRKPSLKPYESADDIRFSWLDEFLQCFKSCKEVFEARNDGNYTENAKSKMFVSWQRFEGSQITVLSFTEVCKFLLQQGVPYNLSERICQELLTLNID